MAILVKSKTNPSDKNRMGTQISCFLDAEQLYGTSFSIDVCAEPETAKCNKFYASAEWFDKNRGDWNLSKDKVIIGFDALECSWPPHWWCNPPFDNKISFIKKACIEAKKGRCGMMLLPYEPLTAWWLKHVNGKATAIYEPDGRYNFLEPDGRTKKQGVNFGSVFVLFTPGTFPTLQRFQFNRTMRRN